MLKSMNNFLNKIAYTNTIVSLGPVGFTLLTFVLLKSEFGLIHLLIPFLVTFFVYSINRITDFKEDIINNPDRTEFFNNKKLPFLIISFSFMILSLFLAWMESLNTLFLVIIPIIAVLLYSLKWIPGKQNRLKDMFIVKNILVALSWAIIPFYVSSILGFLNNLMIMISIFIFLRIFIGVIMFDIRDMYGDSIHGIKTIPVVIGKQKSKTLVWIINILSFILLLFLTINNIIEPVIGLALIMLTFSFGIFYVILIGKIDMKFLCNVIVDSEYILTGLVAFIIFLIL